MDDGFCSQRRMSLMSGAKQRWYLACICPADIRGVRPQAHHEGWDGSV